MSALPDTWEQAQPEVEQRLHSLDSAWDHLINGLDNYLGDHTEMTAQVDNLSKQMDAANKLLADASEQMNMASRQANVVSSQFEHNNKLLQDFVREARGIRERLRPQ